MLAQEFSLCKVLGRQRAGEEVGACALGRGERLLCTKDAIAEFVNSAMNSAFQKGPCLCSLLFK